MVIYQYKKSSRQAVDIVTFILAVALLVVNYTSNGMPAFLVVGLMLVISVGDRLFRPDIWELKITQNEVRWRTPDGSGGIKIRDIESIFHCVSESSIVLVSKQKGVLIPPKCIDVNGDVIDVIRGLASGSKFSETI